MDIGDRGGDIVWYNPPQCVAVCMCQNTHALAAAVTLWQYGLIIALCRCSDSGSFEGIAQDRHCSSGREAPERDHQRD